MAYHYGETGDTRRSDPAFPTTKQFISKVERTIEDPSFGLAKVKNQVELKKWEVQKTEQDLQDKKRHLNASKLYAAVLKLYKQLDTKDQKNIKNWVKKNYKTIAKYKELRNLQKQTQTVRQANKLMQVELKYKSSLLNLKEKDKAAFDTSMRVKSYRPAEEVLKLYEQKNHTLPIFEGAKPKIGPAKLDKNGVAWMPGALGDDSPDWYPKDEIDPFINTLPDDQQLEAHSEYETKIRNINNKTEDLLERLPRLDMDVGTVQKETSNVDEAQAKLQPEINKLVNSINDSELTTAFSILVEIKPERFQTAKSVLDALDTVLNNINTLGDTAPSPAQQIDSLIKSQILESQTVAAEMEQTAKLLTKVENSLQDKPTVEEPITVRSNLKYLSAIALILLLIAVATWRKR